MNSDRLRFRYLVVEPYTHADRLGPLAEAILETTTNSVESRELGEFMVASLRSRNRFNETPIEDSEYIKRIYPRSAEILDTRFGASHRKGDANC